ncbi:putative endonuclease [Bergeriella denitrificans]|uniref:Putative endonuclease n=1 Tax=Bergeriella denitrificans TaxID=494 RepID=A0A378ULR6_BERDE|nr:putative endonuclease [Bergeriella denitrificans]
MSLTRNHRLQPYARDLKQNMSEAEQRLWYHLRGKRLNGIKFRRQQIIGSYIVDFVSMEYKLVVELDGGQHAERTEYDEARKRGRYF